MGAGIMGYLWRLKVAQIESHNCTVRLEAKIDSVNTNVLELGGEFDKHVEKSDRAFERLVKLEQKIEDNINNNKNESS